MKKELNLMLLVLLLSSLFFEVRAQQNFIFNYDFEFYTQCPVMLGQADRCMGFFNLVNSVDYSNCNFDITDFYFSDPGAYSGTGFMTMSTFSDSLGSAEALSQLLPLKLDSGSVYEFHVMTKNADSIQFPQICGGLFLYAFPDFVSGPHPDTTCVANFVGATLLGYTDTISETVWSGKGFTFIAPFDVKAIAFSPACAPNCSQVLFVDSVTISLSVVGISSLEKESINIYPVPVNNQLVISLEKNYQNPMVEVFDSRGKFIFSEIMSSQKMIINTTHWKNGVYLIRVISNENVINKKLIVQH